MQNFSSHIEHLINTRRKRHGCVCVAASSCPVALSTRDTMAPFCVLLNTTLMLPLRTVMRLAWSCTPTWLHAAAAKSKDVARIHRRSELHTASLHSVTGDPEPTMRHLPWSMLRWGCEGRRSLGRMVQLALVRQVG